MARVPGTSTSATLGHKVMSHTIQCPQCGIVLNVPDSAAGRRLKCPQCATKFDAPALDPGRSAVAEPGPMSSLYPSSGLGSSGSVESPTARGPSSGSVELPTSPASLRDTFDLPFLSDPEPKRAPAPKAPAPAPVPAKPAPAKPAPAPEPVADVMALFQDEPKSARKPKGAEARANARRCPTCSSVVLAGMSLCETCGLDLDTGRRVAPLEVFEEELPPPAFRQAPPIGLIFVGTLCATGFAILSIASLVAWSKGMDGAQYLLVIWLFGIYATVQFLRRKAIRPIFIALSLAVGVGAVYLIALPVYYANMPTAAGPVDPEPIPGVIDPEAPDVKPIVVDLTKLSWGVISMLGYAGIVLYLNTPGLRRQFHRN